MASASASAPTNTSSDNTPIANIHVIISTGSGTGQAKTFWEEQIKPTLLQICDQAGDFNVHLTTSETSVSELVTDVILPKSLEGVVQNIVLLSGDGGVVDIVNALLSVPHSKRYKKPAITLLPLGTGNALAHSAGITQNKASDLSALTRGQAREIPIFSARFSPGARLLANEAREERELPIVNGAPTVYGAIVCSWGLHAGLVADSDTAEYRKFGAERFKMAAHEALFPSDGSPPHLYRGKVSLQWPGKDGWQTIPRDEHGYVLATAVSHLEGGFNISPSSELLDGKLWLIHFGPISGQEAMDVMGKAYDSGKHVYDEQIGYQEIEGLRINFAEDDARWRRVCVDGKIIRMEKGGWLEVKMGVKGVVDLNII